MLKISIIEGRNQRRLVLEGKLIAPWAAELRPAYQQAAAGLDGRELVVEVKDVTAINQAGENVLLELIKQGVKFRSYGVFTTHILKQIGRRINRKPGE
jgi:anti-anti-sigma regulatory factor